MENIPATSNGTEQQQGDSVKIDINAIWNESIEASKSPSPAVPRVNGEVARMNGGEAAEDKFSEWLKQELQQAEQEGDKRKEKETSEAKVMALLAAYDNVVIDI